MSTNSYIILELPDNTVRYVYCHYDGYPTHMVPALQNYTSLTEVEELMALGDVRFLDDTLASSEFFCRDRGEHLNIRCANSVDKITHPCEYQYLFRGGKWYMNSFDDRQWREIL